MTSKLSKVNAVSLMALLLVTGLFRSTQIAVQTTFAPFGHDILKLNPSIIGLGITLAGSFAALANFWLVSRLHSGRLRVVILVGLALLSFTIFMIVLGRSVPSYLISTVVFGVSGGLVMPVLATLAGKVPGIARDRALTSYTVALSASLVIGPFIESQLLNMTGGSLGTALLSFAPFPLIAGLLLLFVVPSAESSGHLKRDASSPALISKNAHLRLAIVALILYQVPFVAVTTFGALIAHISYDASASLAQLSFTVFFLFSLTTRLILVWKPPAGRGGLLLRIAAIITLVGILVLGYGHTLIQLITAMALLGIPHGLIYPVSISLVARGTESLALPKANAVLFAATSVASVVTPLVLGVLATDLGYSTMELLVFFPVAILAILLFRIEIPTS